MILGLIQHDWLGSGTAIFRREKLFLKSRDEISKYRFDPWYIHLIEAVRRGRIDFLSEPLARSWCELADSDRGAGFIRLDRSRACIDFIQRHPLGQLMTLGNAPLLNFIDVHLREIFGILVNPRALINMSANPSKILAERLLEWITRECPEPVRPNLLGVVRSLVEVITKASPGGPASTLLHQIDGLSLTRQFEVSRGTTDDLLIEHIGRTTVSEHYTLLREYTRRHDMLTPS